MSRYFLDSSAFVKRYIAEAGTPIEVISGIMRRQRNGEILARVARAARLVLDRHCQRDFIITAMDAPPIHRAEDLIERYPLRANDAVQLAAALESAVSFPASQLVFVSEGLVTEAPTSVHDDSTHNTSHASTTSSR